MTMFIIPFTPNRKLAVREILSINAKWHPAAEERTGKQYSRNESMKHWKHLSEMEESAIFLIVGVEIYKASSLVSLLYYKSSR